MELRGEADVQQPLVVKEEVPPEKQDWSASLDQEDPELPHIKEEQEELWTSQEGEQLQGLEEADITKFPFTPDPVKSEEDDEEKPQSSQLHQKHTEHIETEAAGEDYGGPGSGPELEPEPVPVLVNDLRFSCSECGKIFSTKRTLKEHMRTHTGEKPFSCSGCLRSFTQSGHLQLHMRVHTGEKPFSCSICNKAFGKSGNLKRHMRSHTGEKPFCCTVCQKSFTQSGHLQRHMRIHTVEKPSSCSACGKAFSETRTGEKSCSVCDQRFSWLGDVQQRLVVNEDVPPEQQKWSSSLDPEPPYIKEDQEELWTSQEGEQLQGLEEADITKFPFTPDHVKSEDDEEKPQSSQLHQRHTEQMETEAAGEDCGAAGLGPDSHLEPDSTKIIWPSSHHHCHQSSLNSQNNEGLPVSESRCGAGEKPFSCSECGKRFGIKGNLKGHMRTHTGEKPFSCSVCQKSFTQSGSLQKHMVIHSGEKPYSCSMCDKAFAERGNMKVHMRTHTGEKPFSCSVCGKRYAQSGNLKQHMSVHRRVKRFNCSACDQRFSWLSLLNKHKCAGLQSSELHQTEENGEAAGPGPDRTSDPGPDTDEEPGDSSEPETDDSDDWKETREPRFTFRGPQSDCW